MKAIRVHAFGEPDVLRLEELPVPGPDRGDVLVRLHAAGVNPVDTYIRSGTYARKPALPYTPGTDGAGIVEHVGDGVTEFSAGDRVYVAASLAQRSTGTYAEFAVCDAAHVHRLAKGVTFAQGAAVGVPYATAHRAVIQKARVQPGEVVFVHGASGGVGLACIQLAVGAGARVIGTAGSERGRTLVGATGAEHALDHTKPGYLDELAPLTGGHGVDVIIEMLANENLERDCSVLAMRGRIVIVGSRGSLTFTPRLVMAKDATVIGLSLWNIPQSDLAASHAEIVEKLGQGSLRPVVGRELPLADAGRAHREVLDRGAYGKIVLVP